MKRTVFNMDFTDFIQTFAQDVAKLGHDIRIENIENAHLVNNFAKNIEYIANRLAGSANPNCKALGTRLSDCAPAMLAAYEARDSVTLADVLEYELLEELEEILHEME
jgi:hypothetical protein